MSSNIRIEKSDGVQSSYIQSPQQKENDIRTWIAKKECVCPYAPGLARFVHLPEIESIKMEHVYYLAHELEAFYEAHENGKRVGRWMLMPHREWLSHDDAHTYSERIFWLLNAAYFHLLNDKKSVKAALRMDIEGYDRGFNGEILNPVVGQLPKKSAGVIPPKSLFFTALNPLYKSKEFYRYSPHALLPMVYATEFQALAEKHPNIISSVAFEMAHGGLYEHFGDDLELDLVAFKNELPLWGAIVERTARIIRASSMRVPTDSPKAKGCPGSNLTLFRQSSAKLVDSFYTKYSEDLKILKNIVRRTGVNPKQIIGASFAGSGLYTMPDYP
mgnify:CR=1 FL=1